MATVRCPGQDSQFWKPEDVRDATCPRCRLKVEVWKDDVWRTCPHCGLRFVNPNMDLACAQWCRSAEKCLGPEFVKKMREHLNGTGGHEAKEEKKNA
jgi:hypothetical protein